MAHQETERGAWASKFRGQKPEMFSGKYYAACATGGLVSAGTAHLLITPFDVLKVNMQANPVKYRNIWSGFGTLWKEQGFPGLWRGWGGKLYGYGGQGACKFGFYEYFKKLYCDAAGPANTNSYKTLIYLAGSASAEAIADVVLCPFEAVKVRVQTQPAFAKGLADGFPKLYKTEGFKGFYKGLVPLWGRNLPFSMIMFASFEHSVDFIYDEILQKRKTECSKGVQLGVTAAAGYASGVAGSIVSNPADNIITYIYNNKGHTYAQSLKAVGWVGLFTRSLPLRILLVGPLVTAQWFCVDSLKILMGFAPGSSDYEDGSYSVSQQLEERTDSMEERGGEATLDKASWMATQIDGNGSLEARIDSAANGAKAVPSDPSKKLRILCMHGFRTSGSILAQQVARANWSPLIDDIAELVFIDAPWPARGKSAVEKKFAGPYWEWFQSSEGYIEISGLEEATSHFTSFISLHGPFDGLLGFSQGGVLAGVWMGLCNKGMGPNIGNIRFLIEVGGGRGTARRFQSAYDDSFKFPSLHFIGDNDLMKPYGEHLLTACKDPVVIRHPFGHVVPRLGASEGQIFRDFLLKQLQSKFAS